MNIYALIIKREYDNSELLEELLKITSEESLLGKILRIDNLVPCVPQEENQNNSWWTPNFEYKFEVKNND
mgnify:CR=1 FL=1